ncbi:MAG: hypothetical protein KAR20_00890 [Candidatus Heimdallarchaeota archaeon]|nr:hypothetical protein [Candidatus Heimdallarchaeota archaeon]
MIIKNNQKTHQRLRDIDDRKIEILLEIANINDNYSEKVTRLNSEYAILIKTDENGNID